MSKVEYAAKQGPKVQTLMTWFLKWGLWLVAGLLISVGIVLMIFSSFNGSWKLMLGGLSAALIGAEMALYL